MQNGALVVIICVHMQAANKDDVAPLCQHLLKHLESRQPDGQICKHTLPILTKLISYSPEILTEGKQQNTNEPYSGWTPSVSVISSSYVGAEKSHTYFRCRKKIN